MDPQTLSPANEASVMHAGAGIAAAAAGPCNVWDDPAVQRGFTSYAAPVSGAAAHAESMLAIGGMHCAACTVTIERALQPLAGVTGVEVNGLTERLRLHWKPDSVRLSHVVAVLERAGYSVFPAGAPAAEAQRRRDERTDLWRLFVAGFCMMQVMMYAGATYGTAPGDIEPGLLRLLQWAAWLLTLPVMVFSATPFFRDAWRSLRSRRLSMDVPVAIGIVVTFAASTGATFDPGGVFGSDVYADSLTMFVFFLLSARWLQARLQTRARQTLERLVRRLPDVATVRDADGQLRQTAVARLAVGDLLWVRPGELFVADGTLTGGRTVVDESLLTGESDPIGRSVGDRVVAGSANLGAAVTVRVDAVGADTRHAGIVGLVERALLERPAVARLADRIATPFTAVVLLLALVGGLVWSQIEPGRGLWVAVSVLIVTCPCALSLATPSALLSATAALARRGLLVQRPAALETLSQIGHVVFDKTGTLTRGELQVVGMQLSDGTTAAAALQTAATLASGSRHPVARALVRTASQSGHGAGAGAPAMVTIDEHVGRGIEGHDASGNCWRLGSPAFAGAAAEDAAGDQHHDGPQVVLSRQGSVIARWRFDEALRPDARATVQALLGQGLAVTLLTGDRPAAAQRLARAVGIEHGAGRVLAGATPHDKRQTVQALQAQGQVVLAVGDGLNDAPLLAQADVSACIGDGAPVSRQSADIVLFGNRLADLPAARALALRAMHIVRQNLLWAAGYNLVCVPLALAGALPPWAAGLGMAASSLLVVVNASRLLRRAGNELGLPAPAPVPEGPLPQAA